MIDYVKPERISMRLHPELNEKWVQETIAADPSVLGLGDLILRDKERIHPRAGRLDLLLQDPDSKRRYEVEIQLGSADEAHIIRTIEYWDIERKRYPQYDHAAVLVAEDITSRFLNVVSLFNGTIPLIAIQMQALKVGEKIALVFTTVMDELTRGLVDDDEIEEATPADRSYWEKRGSTKTVKLADSLMNIARELDPALEPKYNKFYIGIAKSGQAVNFITFRPRKTGLILEIKLPRADDVDSQLDEAGIETLEYSIRWRCYRLSITEDVIAKNVDLLRRLMKMAYENRMS